MKGRRGGARAFETCFVLCASSFDVGRSLIARVSLLAVLSLRTEPGRWPASWEGGRVFADAM